MKQNAPQQKKMSRISKIYQPKALIDGSKIGEAPGSTWVAVPDKFAGRKVEVVYAGAKMTINDWRAEAKQFKRFRDKFWHEGSGRPMYYTLGYFRFTPNDEPQQKLV